MSHKKNKSARIAVLSMEGNIKLLDINGIAIQIAHYIMQSSANRGSELCIVFKGRSTPNGVAAPLIRKKLFYEPVEQNRGNGAGYP